jgi:hypothetical protein
VSDSNISGGRTDVDLYTPVIPSFRVQTISKGRHDFCGTYKGYSINIDRDHSSQNWYIIVKAPDGGYVYDGWWRESEGKPLREAIHEALRGSMLLI